MTSESTTRNPGSRMETVKQFIYFSGIGIVGTSGHYLTLVLLVELLNLKPQFATTFGFIIGALINYILNYRYTFRSTKQHRETLTKFLIIAVFGALINFAIMYVGTTHTGIHYLIVQITATSIVLLWNFTLNKVWTFTSKN